jgi:hypothetical protein
MAEVAPTRAPLSPGRGETVLVFGSGTDAAPLWAAGLAYQLDPRFAWADLAPPTASGEKDERLLMARSSEGAWINGARPEDLAPPTLAPDALDALIRPGPGPDDRTDGLTEFLGLPAIVQLLAGRATRPDGGATIVLLGLDAVPPSLLATTFGSASVHASLRAEGIRCIATYRGSPPPALRDLFDAAFRIDAATARDWSRTVVQAVRGNLPPELHRPRSFPDQWTALGLSPALMLLWTESGRVPRRPR